MSNSLETMLGLPKKVEFDEQQLLAIEQCTDVTKRLVAVTGGAGTGKTLLIKEIYNNLTAAGYTVAVSAPTGKAAKRILESTGIMALTNHRLLGYGMPIESEEEQNDGTKKVVRLSTGPKYTRARPLEYDVLLCDEYAMVNTEIHRNLVDALKPRAMMRVFGDVNQLKPIEGEGYAKKNAPQLPSPFEMLLQKFNPVTLKTVHRQAEGSGVAANAAAILKGQVPKKLDDFAIVWSDEPIKSLINYIEDQKENSGHDFSTTDAQVITVMNKTWVGVKRLNPVIQQLFWKQDRRGIELPRHRWSEDEKVRIQVGSKVVYTSNTYDLGNGHYALNGEVGVVMEIDYDLGVVDIDFGDRVVSVPPLTVLVSNDGSVREFDPRKNIDLAYALTTHKMQGSEVPHVVYLLNKSTSFGQSRRNFYTAVSRARKSCVVISDQGSMLKSVKFEG